MNFSILFTNFCQTKKKFSCSGSFASFLIVSLVFFINKPDSSRKLTVFIIPFISSLETINVVCFANSEGRVPDLNIILLIAASVADATAVNATGVKMLLANGLSTFPIEGNPVFSNSPKSRRKNPPDCHILCNGVLIVLY